MTVIQVFAALLLFTGIYAWQMWRLRRSMEETQAALLEIAANSWEMAAQSETEKREAFAAEARVRRMIKSAIEDREVGDGSQPTRPGEVRLPGAGAAAIADDPTLDPEERIRRFLLREQAGIGDSPLQAGRPLEAPEQYPQLTLDQEIEASVEAAEAADDQVADVGDDDDQAEAV